eukprot:763576-Hanusia_phi.AAC.9
MYRGSDDGGRLCMGRVLAACACESSTESMVSERDGRMEERARMVAMMGMMHTSHAMTIMTKTNE